MTLGFRDGVILGWLTAAATALLVILGTWQLGMHQRGMHHTGISPPPSLLHSDRGVSPLGAPALLIPVRSFLPSGPTPSPAGSLLPAPPRNPSPASPPRPVDAVDSPAAAPLSPHPIKAYVLSAREARWQHASALLARCGLSPTRVTPLDWRGRTVQLNGRFQDLPHYARFAKTLSNKLTHMHIWRAIAFDASLPEDGFSIIFEDDVELSQSIEAGWVPELARGAADLVRGDRSAGVFYLGLCGPQCLGGDEASASGVETHGIAMRRCVGRCAHAYGVLKSHAAFLYEQLAAVTALKGSQFFYADNYLHAGLKALANATIGGLPILIGAGLQDPRAERRHQGVFFQDRQLFKSEIMPQGAGAHKATVGPSVRRKQGMTRAQKPQNAAAAEEERGGGQGPG